jgi:Tol biopolymer transport system component
LGSAVTVTLSPPEGIGGAYWPAVSPDGQYVYFSNVQGFSAGLWRASRLGGQVETLLGGELFRPSISRDGRYMAYHEGSSQNPDGVAVTVFDLLTRTRVANEMPGRFPEWAPTTDLIVAIDGQSRRLVIMGRDGSGRRFLTPADHGYPDGQLTWSPDGQWILARGPVSLELIHVASGLILPLGFTRSMAEPAWRPGS